MASLEDAEDDDVQLPMSTLNALAEFYEERDNKDRQFEELQAQAEDDFRDKLSMTAFEEDWNASQFWYTEETSMKLAKALLVGADSRTQIAVVSAPSVFVQLKNLLSTWNQEDRPGLCLLEYDTRFSVFKEFQYYDFADPLRLSENLKGSFNRLICDPPFLSNDCQTKTALTARWLSRSATADDTRVIVCTGERMADLVLKLYAAYGIRATDFTPSHSRGLSNEFQCFSNFTIEEQ